MANPVEGPAGPGQDFTRPPVAIAGVDSNGKVRHLLLDSSGKLNLATSTVNIGEVQLLGADGLHVATVDASGNVVAVLAAGTAAIGDVNIAPAARGGYAVSSQVALTTTATVSAAAGKFGGGMFINLNSAPAYIQVFDTTAAVTLGTTVPTFVIPIPANATPANGAAFIHEFAGGLAITNGIKVAATTTPTGASTVGTALTGFVLYK